MTQFKFAVETLEGREIPSITWAALPNNVLQITSDNASDRITIRNSGTGVSVNGKAFSNVSQVLVYGNGGNDTIDCAGVSKVVVAHGGSGTDLIIGGNHNDFLYGNDHTDVIWGGGGNDVLRGDGGNDRLFGQTGSDKLYGGDDSDFMDDGDLTRHEFYDGGSGADFIADAWTIDGCKVGDVVQGMNGHCQYLAGLAAGCDAGIAYNNYIKYRGPDSTGTGHYDVTIWNPATRTNLTTRVVFAGDSNLTDALTAAEVPDRVAEYEYWPLLMRRAYASRINSGNFAVGLESATYGKGSWVPQSNVNIRTTLLNALNNNRPVTTAIDHASLYGITNHALAIVGWRGSSSAPELLVYNPWGRDARGTNNQSVAVDGVNDGYFWVTWNQFRSYFDGGIYVR